MKRIAKSTLESVLFPVNMVNASDVFNLPNITRFNQAVTGLINGQLTILGLHGSQYTLNPNEKFINNILSGVNNTGIKYTTEVYNTNNTRFNIRVVLDGIKFSFTNDKGQTRDNLSPMLDIWNSYDGSVSPTFTMSTYRQICSNGMIGLKAVASIRKKATKQVLYAFDSVPNMIDEFIKDFENQGAIITRLSDKKVDNLKDKIVDLAKEFDLFKTHTMSKGVITGYSDNVELIANSIQSEANVLGSGVNNWLLYNGLNQWLFSLENSLTEPNREKIDVAIVNRLLEV